MKPILKELLAEGLIKGKLTDRDIREAAEKLALGESYVKFRKTRKLLNQMREIWR